MPIKAIETRYRGYRFRSRLEARWAVFFDKLKIKWNYEPEGFVLADGTCYLADFRVDGSALCYWVEVKATEPTEAEKEKLQQLCWSTGKLGIFLIGEPGKLRPLVLYDEWVRLPTATAAWEIDRDIQSSAVKRAVEAARGARFEHGESGAA